MARLPHNLNIYKTLLETPRPQCQMRPALMWHLCCPSEKEEKEQEVACIIELKELKRRVWKLSEVGGELPSSHCVIRFKGSFCTY